MCLGYTVTEFQETPNPNAVKCVLDRPVTPGPGEWMRSYQSVQAAAPDPLAAALMAVPGVVGVFIHQGWVTVSKSPDTDWKGVKAAVRKVLSGAQ